jgi:hypothetical protein
MDLLFDLKLIDEHEYGLAVQDEPSGGPASRSMDVAAFARAMEAGKLTDFHDAVQTALAAQADGTPDAQRIASRTAQLDAMTTPPIRTGVAVAGGCSEAGGAWT